MISEEKNKTGAKKNKIRTKQIPKRPPAKIPLRQTSLVEYKYSIIYIIQCRPLFKPTKDYSAIRSQPRAIVFKIDISR